MDLEGMGAMGAVFVAAVGIPATVLVGRWQMRAALRSAEATSQAGISQAQATYRAALDQAAAQTTATHDQWRRGIRRDTWAAFLLSVEDAVSSGHSARSGTDEDLPALRRAVKTTLVVLELEGPPSVVAAANLVWRTIWTSSRVTCRHPVPGTPWRGPPNRSGQTCLPMRPPPCTMHGQRSRHWPH